MQSINSCPRCHTSARTGARFCTRCGYNYHASNSSSSLEHSVPSTPVSAYPTVQPISPQTNRQNTLGVRRPPSIPPSQKPRSQSHQFMWPISRPSQRPRPPKPEPHTQTAPVQNSLSFIATSKAAEHWRTSWRNRQRVEAGPATDVSRGQSSVPAPLMTMQHSFARIRAITKLKQNNRNPPVRFWVTVMLMLCLIAGLAVYIISSYLLTTDIPTNNHTSMSTLPPDLTAQGLQGITIPQGQALHIHGANFDVSDPILFLLDDVTTIRDTKGTEIAIRATNQGTFDVAVPITTRWSVGAHVISAQDSKTGQNAYLNIQVSLSESSATTSDEMALSLQHQSLSKLTFQAVIGQGNPREKFITLTNRSNAPLQWLVTASTDNNLSWLAIDTTTTGGKLGSRGTGMVGVNSIITGLKSNANPYTGKIVFTINGTQQLTLPIELQIQEAAAEMVFSPNPMIGLFDAAGGGTCQLGSTLTLINLGTAQVHWQVNLDPATKPHIQFLLNGNPDMQGTLAPSGQTGDTLGLTLACRQVHFGDTYHFTMSINGTSSLGAVFIQTP